MPSPRGDDAAGARCCAGSIRGLLSLPRPPKEGLRLLDAADVRVSVHEPRDRAGNPDEVLLEVLERRGPGWNRASAVDLTARVRAALSGGRRMSPRSRTRPAGRL